MNDCPAPFMALRHVIAVLFASAAAARSNGRSSLLLERKLMRWLDDGAAVSVQTRSAGRPLKLVARRDSPGSPA
jgi:hypothetical protein